MDTNILATLNPVFQEVFGDDSIEINMGTTADDIPDWDSITHIELIVAVEKHFNIQFKSADLPSLHNVGDLVHLIKNKQVNLS